MKYWSIIICLQTFGLFAQEKTRLAFEESKSLGLNGCVYSGIGYSFKYFNSSRVGYQVTGGAAYSPDKFGICLSFSPTLHIRFNNKKNGFSSIKIGAQAIVKNKVSNLSEGLWLLAGFGVERHFFLRESFAITLATHHLPVDLDGLENGTYSIKIQQPNGIEAVQLVKMRD